MKDPLIFDIQHFSLHDGPGIRTTVFFKGCTLHCAWCHNPESIDPNNGLYFDDQKCIGCGACKEVCSNDVHSFSKGRHEVVFSKCRLCGDCIESCLPGALRFVAKSYSKADLKKVLLRDKSLYEKSGGGVTFSGGEPLLQSEFIRELATEMKKEGIHICVDTALNISGKNIDDVLDVTDIFLCDLKAVSKDIFREFVGDSNDIILDNLMYLSKKKDIFIRIPLIPGVNTERNEIMKMTEVIDDLGDGVKEVGLLSYHDLGVAKARKIGRTERQFDMLNETDQMWIVEMFKRKKYRLLVDGKEVR